MPVTRSALPDLRRHGKGLDRRRFLQGGLLVAGAAITGPTLLAACGDDDDAELGGGSPEDSGGSGGPAEIAYQLSWLPTVEHAGSFIAADRGYYTEEDLDITLVPGGPNVQVESQLVGGQAVIGGSTADRVALAVTEGAPLKIFGARFQKSPFCILSLASSPLAGPEDLAGKRIGVNQSNQTPFDLLLALNDVDPAAVEVVPVQFDPTPVAEGEVDGQIVFAINEPLLLEAQGIATSTFLLADFGYAVYSGAYVATEETISDRADELAAFLRAERRGFEDNLANPQLGTDLAVQDYGADLDLDPEQQLLESEELARIMVTPETEEAGLLVVTDDGIDANIATLSEAGIDVDGTTLFTTEILEML